MSHQATTWVMEFSQSRLADRLVLCAIAHRVSSDNGEPWPSVATIAREANLSESSVHASLKKLRALGELEIEEGASEYGTNLYRLPKFIAWMETLHLPRSGRRGGTKSAPSGSRKRSAMGVQSGGTDSAPQPSLNHQEKPSEEKTSAASPPGDPRRRTFIDFAKETFRTKHHGDSPIWTGEDYRQLGELLKCSPDLALEELKRRWMDYLASPQSFIRDQGDSLKFFCRNLDRFIDGPLFAAPKPNDKGAMDADERTRRNLAAAGLHLN